MNINAAKRPHPEFIAAAEAVLMAKAYVETLRPVVEGYQRKILNEHHWHIAKKWVDMGEDDEVITDPNHTYLMEDEDFKEYLRLIRIEQDKAGLKTDNPDHCPLLVAEHLESQAKHVLIEEAESITGISFDDIMRKFSLYNQYVDLLLSLAVSTGKVKNRLN